ncbi:MAG: polysaccharide deacetylase family protein [Spirochaetes bacterium]|nr:MAG: polysaccharide deacetylase family protein [Spirochaetota bacterium]
MKRAPWIHIGIILFALLCGAGIIWSLVFSRGDAPVLVTDGLPSWRAKGSEDRSRNNSVPVLLYHNIDGAGGYSLDYEKLRAQFELLRTMGVHLVRLDTLVEHVALGKALPRKTVAISFDDDFFSFYEKLLPLAREFGYPVTLFVYTSQIFNRGDRNLTWKRLLEMERAGISIQCHSATHPDLVRLLEKNTPESRQKLFEEIYLAKRKMELYLGKEIRYFAFPYGRFTTTLAELCREAGFERTFSTEDGTNIMTRNNFCLRRRHIKKDDSEETVRAIVE